MPETTAKRRDALAVLAALSLFFATIEYLFPKPLPFFRLGLANLPIILALDILKPREIILLALMKVLGQGLINGTLASYVFLFSAAGTAASVLVMMLVHRAWPRWVSLIGVSLFGALASNAVQISLSVTFIFGQSAWIIAPYFIALGAGSGFLVGLFAQRFHQKSRWLQAFRSHLAG